LNNLMKMNMEKSHKRHLKKFPWMDRLRGGWAIYKKNLLGKIGLSLLVMFALMARLHVSTHDRGGPGDHPIDGPKPQTLAGDRLHGPGYPEPTPGRC